ncbi:MAG: cobyrinate a,c-diamide synthase [Mobilicoccus sp.]|nr:cobyrinate a,c-diamide synthase [Mobilicoccus sp.]
MSEPSSSRTRLPRICIAAPSSGSGKTMITTGLLAALAARGLVVSPHKVGPDYIDPGYHAAACGRRGRNLDAHMQGVERIVPLLLRGALGRGDVPAADVAVIEGVMGLFDGALGRRGFAGTAHIAQVTSTPVVLVVDCASTSRSVGALVHGFATFEAGVRLGGVILNNLASPRHEREARSGLADAGVPVLGAVPRRKDVVVPSRHLGLVPAAERAPEARAAVDALADLVAGHVDLDELLALARTAPDLEGQAWDPAAELAAVGFATSTSTHRPRVAVAGGEAFTFSYAENTELLEAAGLEVVTVDPLTDDLPRDVAGIVIGGGFPEIHAARLSANTALRRDVAEFAASGGPIVAECAGLLYLAAHLDDHPMCGVLPLRAAMTERLTLGYRQGVALTGSVVAAEGARVVGHEFHRTAVHPLDAASAPPRAWGWQDHEGEVHREGWVQGNVHASYLHCHWAGAPGLAASFAAAAREQG